MWRCVMTVRNCNLSSQYASSEILEWMLLKHQWSPIQKHYCPSVFVLEQGFKHSLSLLKLFLDNIFLNHFFPSLCYTWGGLTVKLLWKDCIVLHHMKMPIADMQCTTQREAVVKVPQLRWIWNYCFSWELKCTNTAPVKGVVHKTERTMDYRDCWNSKPLRILHHYESAALVAAPWVK